MDSRVDPGRIRNLREAEPGPGPILYWMRRDQRARDSWGLTHAQDLALALGRPLAVVMAIVPDYLGATLRQYHVMFKGMAVTSPPLDARGIPTLVRLGSPGESVARLAIELKAARVVCDFSPLRFVRRWDAEFMAAAGDIGFDQVDDHNIVPCWEASDKAEHSARTIRPKIKRLLPRYLTPYPEILPHPHSWPDPVPDVDWDSLMRMLPLDKAVGRVPLFVPGSEASQLVLENFIRRGLQSYAEKRNDPNALVVSGLSPYLHFGHIAPQTVALAISTAEAPKESREDFLEELIIRRELSDNFCYYNPRYDEPEGFPAWARQTLDEHRGDPRPDLYSYAEFEAAGTHDPLWNAAQTEMLLTGRMHGFMRMYWAKKILEWSESPEEAHDTAVRLNDRYSLDGRDPNGYAGIAWSIGGVHDRGWPERAIYGKVRSMTLVGCRRKFNVDAYVSRVERMAEMVGP